MTDVFISYKRRMRPKVEQIAAALEALGLDVWYDAELEAGISFSAEISARVRAAKCVLVCWSDDAFPHGGDRNGWVLGEATIGQQRGCLVPVLVERADLDPPWNTIHTELLIGWNGAPDHPGFRNMLAAIGRHVGRPDLAGDAVAAPPMPKGPAVPSASAIAVAALAGAVLTAIGAALFAAADPNLIAGYYAILPGVAAYALVLAALFYRAGVLSPLKAVLMVGGFVLAFGIGVVLGHLAIGPIRSDPTKIDMAELILCAVAGFVGAALSLSLFPLLGLAPRRLDTALRIVIAAIALSAVAAFIAATPFFRLDVSNSGVLWLGAIWQLAYAPLLVFVLRVPKPKG